MLYISFAWTTPALLAGAKTVTRRDWRPGHAARFRSGLVVNAYDKLPMYGGRVIGQIRLTADGCRNQTCLFLEAALFHVMLHLVEKESGDLKRQDHDFSGFYSEAQVYGAWRRDLRQAYEVMAQLALAL